MAIHWSRTNASHVCDFLTLIPDSDVIIFSSYRINSLHIGPGRLYRIKLAVVGECPYDLHM